jgi:hypothetical protein
VSGDGARTDLLHEVLGFKKVAGRHVAEIHVASGSYGQYAYLGAYEGGLYRYQNSRLGDHPGIYEEIPPRELLRPGLKEGESWSWEEDILYQTAGKVSEEQERAERRKHRLATTATIEAVGKPFHTPAGDFSVTVVRYDSKSEALGRETIRRWISLDVGIVREESGSGENRRVMELVRYDPAR